MLLTLKKGRYLRPKRERRYHVIVFSMLSVRAQFSKATILLPPVLLFIGPKLFKTDSKRIIDDLNGNIKCHGNHAKENTSLIDIKNSQGYFLVV